MSSQCTCLPGQEGGPCHDCVMAQRIYDLQELTRVQNAFYESALPALEKAHKRIKHLESLLQKISQINGDMSSSVRSKLVRLCNKGAKEKR